MPNKVPTAGNILRAANAKFLSIPGRSQSMHQPQKHPSLGVSRPGLGPQNFGHSRPDESVKQAIGRHGIRR